MSTVGDLKDELLNHRITLQGYCLCGARLGRDISPEVIAYHVAESLTRAGFGRVAEPAAQGGIVPGMEVRVIQTSHKDLLGSTGLVRYITPSGNYEVMIGIESVVLGPQQVERAS